MGGKTKLTLGAVFAMLAVSAAAAFGQGGATSSPDPTAAPKHAHAGAKAHDGAKAHEGCGHPGARRHHRGDRVVHGETKIQVDGGFATMTVDRGVVTAVDATAKTVSIKRADGETVSVTASDATKVCRDGKKATLADVKTGDHAGIMQGDKDGTHLVRAIRASSGAEPTPGAQTSAGDGPGSDGPGPDGPPV